MAYYSGQGRVYVAERDASGNPGGFRWLGNVPSLELSIETDKFEHKESYTGNRATDVTVVTETNATVSFTIEDFDIDNLALGFFGANSIVTGTTVSNETIEVDVLDRPYRLANPNNVGSVTITASVEDTDFTVDVTNGTVTPLSTGNLSTGTITIASYTFDTYTRTDVFTTTSKEVWLRFEGLSTLTGGETVLIDCYKVSIDPLTGYALINDEIGSVEMTGSILVDDTRPAGQQFFQQINIPRV